MILTFSILCLGIFFVSYSWSVKKKQAQDEKIAAQKSIIQGIQKLRQHYQNLARIAKMQGLEVKAINARIVTDSMIADEIASKDVFLKKIKEAKKLADKLRGPYLAKKAIEDAEEAEKKRKRRVREAAAVAAAAYSSRSNDSSDSSFGGGSGWSGGGGGFSGGGSSSSW